MDTITYYTQLDAFVLQLKSEQDTQKVVHVESGRKFDRVYIDEGIRYFIEKDTGTIFGARSRAAPNLKWYFGTLDTAHLWHWSRYHGEPINDLSIRLIGTYGGYHHYMRVD